MSQRKPLLPQLLMNLAVNARDAMPNGGRLEFATGNVERTEAHGDVVELRVKDDGVGMTETERSRAFEPLFREPERGTGFGLSTVFGIVDRHGGSIRIESGPRQGTEFRITWPRLDRAPSVAPKRTAISHTPSRGEVVLVVEDEEAVRRRANSS